MYKNGELIFYGSTGVCRVEGTEKRPEKGGGREYYVLKPTCQDGTIYIPVDTQVYMRPVISREEAERLIDTIPGVKAEEIRERSFTQLAAHYEQLISGTTAIRCCGCWFPSEPRRRTPRATAASLGRSTRAISSGRKTFSTASSPLRSASTTTRSSPT